MRFHAVAKTMAGAAAALFIAGCGGGGGGGDVAEASVQLSGTAAVGAALADASVTIKCATGGGSTTTSASGAYSASLAGAALPCIIQVSGTAGGATVVLHSIAAAGTTTGSSTTAVANVTPVSEMIVAQLTGVVPAEAFSGFDAQKGKATASAIDTAVDAIVGALKTAGIDLGDIDPLRTTLVAANGTTAGNAFDQLLDALGDKVSPQALTIVVAQIANATASGSGAALGDAMTAVAKGSLEGCPWAVSGKYRSLEYTGQTDVHALDFSAMTLTTGSSGPETITKLAGTCEFAIGEAHFVMGTGGVASYVGPDFSGYLFPLQSHTMAAVATKWNFLESGLNESNQGEHFFGQFDIRADGSVAVCEYDVMSGATSFGSCAAVTDETVSVAAASDGGFTLQYGTDTTRMWGYRGPSGHLSLFGSSNAANSNEDGTYRTHFLMVQPQKLELPAAGTVSKYWDVEIAQGPGGLAGAPIRTDSVTVKSTDPAAGTVTRERTSDARIDTFRVNYPVDGIRFREASGEISSVFQIQLLGLGITASIDNMPGHFYAMSVSRP